MKKMLIVGGSDAGISAALRIKELDLQAKVSVVVADAFPNFSICGLPFYLSGEVPDWRTLAHRSVEEIEQHGIDLLLEHRALAIDSEVKQMHVRSDDGTTCQLEYDKLLIATGAESVEPPIGGLENPGVFFLRWMDDSFAVKKFLDRENPNKAVIIGGGYIGLEMADALTHKGITVTLLEFAPEVLTTLDPELGAFIRAELQSKGVRVVTGQAVQHISRNENILTVHTASGETVTADMVLVAAGAKPSTQLARSADIGLGAGNAIQVDSHMATQTTDIWAAGDCVQTWHRILERHVYMPLGTTAHKQGRVAGENMLGGSCEFKGSLGTQVVKVLDQVAARTGLREHEASEAGFDPLTVMQTTWDHKVYYPGAKEMHIRLTGDRSTGRLLGAQLVGHRESEVSKRVDIVATALYHGMAVKELCDLDLSYTPPLSSPWDPIQMSAMLWCSKL
ncbi:MAG: CoA-disulfide reductase [Deltaproteobacteria bacterium]|nr:MAG: CoA-disulfide reductase [Deltaproteobacteria bacterium]